MRPGILVLAGLLLAAGPLSGQVILAGFVREDSTDRPIADVEVILEGSTHRAVTNANGKFVMASLPRGSRVALFRALGWRPVRAEVLLAAGDTVWTEVSMIREPVRLAPVEVTGTRRAADGIRDGFEDRRRMGFGKFLDSTMLRSAEHLRLPDVLRRIEGITMKRSGASVFALSTRRAGCFMQVILDGNMLYRGMAPTSQDTVAHPPPDFAKDFDIPALESIEIYRSAAETPGEFSGSGAACGTIVLWSRRH